MAVVPTFSQLNMSGNCANHFKALGAMVPRASASAA